MTKKELIVRLCQLCTSVGEYYNHKFATDCFCPDGIMIGNKSFNFDEVPIKFIEAAVKEKMERESK